MESLYGLALPLFGEGAHGSFDIVNGAVIGFHSERGRDGREAHHRRVCRLCSFDHLRQRTPHFDVKRGGDEVNGLPRRVILHEGGADDLARVGRAPTTFDDTVQFAGRLAVGVFARHLVF